MKKEKIVEKEGKRTRMSRRYFCKAVTGVSLIGASSTLELFASAQDKSTEPENLDLPTAWQEGDPEPIEKKIWPRNRNKPRQRHLLPSQWTTNVPNNLAPTMSG